MSIAGGSEIKDGCRTVNQDLMTVQAIGMSEFAHHGIITKDREEGLLITTEYAYIRECQTLSTLVTVLLVFQKDHQADEPNHC